jgi:hypothetical protein
LIIVAFFDRGDRLTVVAFAAWLMMAPDGIFAGDTGQD